MSLSASWMTASWGLATNALRRNDGSWVGCPPHQMPRHSTASAPSPISVVLRAPARMLAASIYRSRPPARPDRAARDRTAHSGRVFSMPAILSTTAPNGLPVHRISVPGTRAMTALVAFDAGARSEHPQENGVAHFLEHLVFKGGERYAHYREVNETAERMGATINAYTSHDLVAFHITCRAEAAPEALDLLTDIAGRPRLDQDELERERGVVIQEINRAHDQPAVVAGHLIDRAAFGDHPLGRPVLGPEEHLRDFSREAIVGFRERRWSPGRGGAFLVGNTSHVPDDAQLDELFSRFPTLPDPPPFEPAPPLAP